MLIYIFVLVCVTQVLALNEGPLVNTTEGQVLGYQAADGNYYAFFDLNYAGPTSGENRFKAPVPPQQYPGIYHAMQRQIICAQPSKKLLKIIGTEDCLTLSVFTQNITTSKPVLVFIDGEDYTTTSTKTYSYKRLVEAGLVVVPMNYRLSIFGFLCLGVPEAPGNAGLKDVIHGLKWIKQNIQAFGGDPNNIVLFGHGSGAAIADLITLSPQSKDLVNKAIVQSGSALAPWAVAYDPVGYAKSFGTSIGYNKKTNHELANLLKTADIDILINAIETYESFNNTALFAPCIESSNLNDTILTDAPINLLKSGNYTHVPYMTGYTNKEGTLRIEKALYNNWLEKMNANFTEFLPVDLQTEANSNVSLSATLREYYFKNLPIDKAVIEDFLDYEGDTLVLVSVIRGAKERAQTSQSEVRLYEFAYRGTLNSDWTYPQVPLTGVKHGEILNYLFDYDLLAQDEPVRSSLVTRFVSFALTGVPNNNLRNSAWMPLTRNETHYLYYSGGQGSNESMYTETSRFNPHATRMTLWNDLYFKYYKAPTAPSSAERLISFGVVVVLCHFVVSLF